jgi:hypothetical protein
MVEARLKAPAAVPKRRFLKGTAGSVLLGVWMLGFLLRARPEAMEDWWNDLGRRRGSTERNASTCLKTITSAQADFRANDRDGDGLHQFWRGDIAGLYTLKPRGHPEEASIKLIELSVASADDRAVTDISPYAVKSAKAGYWFRAILHEDEATPDPDRFAACAFPDSPSAGKWIFITDESNTIWRKELRGQRGIDRYPLDPRKAGWLKLD